MMVPDEIIIKEVGIVCEVAINIVQEESAMHLTISVHMLQMMIKEDQAMKSNGKDRRMIIMTNDNMIVIGNHIIIETRNVITEEKLVVHRRQTTTAIMIVRNEDEEVGKISVSVLTEMENEDVQRNTRRTKRRRKGTIIDKTRITVEVTAMRTATAAVTRDVVGTSKNAQNIGATVIVTITTAAIMIVVMLRRIIIIIVVGVVIIVDRKYR
jgi:hypothetical protein